MQILSEKTLVKTPFARFVRIRYGFSPNGKIRKWYGVRRSTPNAVIVVAFTQSKETILVRQPRPLIGKRTLEFPAGLLDVKGETVLETAERELLEETGYKASNFEILIGGEKGLVNSPGITDERTTLVVARDAVKVQEPLTNEHTEPLLLPIATAFETLLELSKKEEVGFKVFGNLTLAKMYEGRK